MKTIMLSLMAGLVISSAASAEGIEDRYNKTCVVCHAAGTANAPKTHDVAAWQPRLAKGMEVLVQSVEKGLNAMPPKGMCFDCSVDEYKALIEYMAKPK
jgi:cytochrome c5